MLELHRCFERSNMRPMPDYQLVDTGDVGSAYFVSVLVRGVIVPSLTVTAYLLDMMKEDHGRHTQEENLIGDALRGADLQLFDRCLQVGPPIDTLVDEAKVIVELVSAMPLAL